MTDPSLGDDLPAALPAASLRGDVVRAIAMVVITQLALLVSGPLLARSLGVAGRGRFALLTVIPQVVGLVASLGLAQSATYFIATNPASARAVVRRIARIATWSTLAAMAVYLLVGLLLIGPGTHEIVLVITLAAIPAAVLQSMSFGVLLGAGRSSAGYGVFIVTALLRVTAIVVVFVSGSESVDTMLAAFVGASVIGGCCGAWMLRGVARGGGHEPGPDGRELVSFGLRGIVSANSPIEQLQLDQALVGVMLTPSQMGLYVTGLSLSNAPRILGLALGFVAFPAVARAAPEDQSRIERRILQLALALGALATVGIVALTPEILELAFGEEFLPAVTAARILAIGGFLLGSRRVLAETTRGRGRPGLSAMAEAPAWVILLVGVVIAAGPFGPAGVAWAFLASALAGLATLGWLRRRTDQPQEAST